MTTCNLKSLARDAAHEFASIDRAVSFIEAEVLSRPMTSDERREFAREFSEQDARERDAIARDRAEEDAASLRHG